MMARLFTLLILTLLLLLSTKGHSQSPLIDLNNNGMSDVWEAIYAAEAVSPNVDTDKDGRTNLEEANDGTNPFSARSVLRAETLEVNLSNNEATLRWRGEAGKSYRFQGSSELQTWSSAGQPLAVNSSGPTSTVFAFAGNTSALFLDLEAFDVDLDSDGLNAWEESQLGFFDDPQTTAPDDYEKALERLTMPACEEFGDPGPVSLDKASRFLTQATLGPTYEMIESVAATGYSTWIEEQFLIPPSYHLPTNIAIGRAEVEGDEVGFTSTYVSTWWNQAILAPDVLRQRVAFALSEILVVSMVGLDILEDRQWAMAYYYDVLLDGSFGNYRDLLYQVSRHPVMGTYLSHAKNRRSDPANNRFPDENYAREVMQLFTIGLYELNQDGSRKLDSGGNFIPTYTNADISEFAKVFTGMTFDPRPVPGIPYQDYEDDEAAIESEFDFIDVDEGLLNRPMALYGPMHEPGVKRLLNGQTTNGGATNAGIETDLNAALDNLFNHPNVGPFIGRLLIQRLVKSNPSPGYISRVAAAFNDNGSGVRGDMRAVIRAILLDREARCVASTSDPAAGMLREPAVRYTHIARAFKMASSSGNFGGWIPEGMETMKQTPLSSPSVFNFFLPDHQPLGPIAEAGLVAPEFQITTATTTIGSANFWANALTYDELLFFEFEEDSNLPEITFDLSAEVALLGDLPALIDRLDLLLTRGQLSTPARTIIQNAITTAQGTLGGEELVRFAIYLFVNSPEFTVLR